jgi:hypothetical protein
LREMPASAEVGRLPGLLRRNFPVSRAFYELRAR